MSPFFMFLDPTPAPGQFWKPTEENLPRETSFSYKLGTFKVPFASFSNNSTANCVYLSPSFDICFRSPLLNLGEGGEGGVERKTHILSEGATVLEKVEAYHSLTFIFLVSKEMF